MIDNNLLKSYNLLIDTLKISCLDSENQTEDEIENNLEELEGDYYSFFHYHNLSELHKAGIINDLHVAQIDQLRNDITNITGGMWNRNALKNEIQWDEVRRFANEILNSLESQKGKVNF